MIAYKTNNLNVEISEYLKFIDNGAPYKNSQLDLLAARVVLSLFQNRSYYDLLSIFYVGFL